MEGNKSQVKFIHSLSTKMALIVFVCVLVATSCTAFIGLRKMRKVTESLVQDYAQSMAEDSARSLNSAELGGVEITAEVAAQMVADAHMKGVDSSYIYVCDSDGIMLYHPTAEKIGNKVENAAVNEIVTQLSQGKVPEPGAIIYDFKGVEKLAGYCVSNSKKIVVMTADLSEATGMLYTTKAQMYQINFVNIVVMTLIFFFISKAFFYAIRQLVGVVDTTAKFDFRKLDGLEKLMKRNDEIGLVGRSLDEMTDKLREIVSNIDAASSSLDANIADLKESTNTVNAMCTDNSATTQQIAAGMEETSATTENMNGNIKDMLVNSKDIDNLAGDGVKLSDEVSTRATDLKKATVESTKKTEDIYVSVKDKAEVAIENAKVVSKINEMTDTIMEISSQTSLLALNASIEAARAGESGRGFAVVATEIGNLATQTARTVSDIDDMVKEVVASVNQMQECLEETTSFIGENVINDYKEFEKISDQYNNDALDFKDSMSNIRRGIEDLNRSIAQVAESISGINDTVTEAATGITGIAHTTTDIVKVTEVTASKANDCRDSIADLDNIVKQFTLA